MSFNNNLFIYIFFVDIKKIYEIFYHLNIANCILLKKARVIK